MATFMHLSLLNEVSWVNSTMVESPYCLEDVLVHPLVSHGFEMIPVKGRLSRAGAANKHNYVKVVLLGEYYGRCDRLDVLRQSHGSDDVQASVWLVARVDVR